jgi:cytochrome c oxidase cbb3-type subunit IV
MSAGVWSGVVTALLLVCFLAGVAWAWSGRRKRDFDEASRLPLHDDDSTSPKDPR